MNTLKFVPAANGVVNGTPNYSTSAFNETLTDDKGEWPHRRSHPIRRCVRLLLL